MRRGGRPAVRARRLGPGDAQPQQVSLPGGTDFVTAAEPDGNLDLYLTPDGDPDRTFELTQTPSARTLQARSRREVGRLRGGRCRPSDLYLMTLDDRQRPVRSERLLDGPGNLSETSWSPDGTQLLVRSDTEHGGNLYRYDFATEDLQPFLENAYNPAWSPDGRSVAFASIPANDPTDVDVFVAGADGSHRRLVVDTGYDDFFPVWAPEGNRLAFASEVQGAISTSSW